jgi:hypothetical protein
VLAVDDIELLLGEVDDEGGDQFDHGAKGRNREPPGPARSPHP